MPWIPIHEADLTYAFDDGGDQQVSLVGATVTRLDGEEQAQGWSLDFAPAELLFRVTALSYDAPHGCPFDGNASINFGGYSFPNEAIDPQTEWSPTQTEAPAPASGISYNVASGGECGPPEGNYQFLIEVWVEDAACFWTDLVGVTQECG